MNNASRIIDRIRNENIRPSPRWKFSLVNGISWLGFILAVIFGALAFSVILFAIQQVDFNILAYMPRSWLSMILSLVPLIWIVSLLLLIILAIFILRNSRKGYKIPPLNLIGFCVFISMLVGTVFFITGGAGWLEQSFALRVNAYRSINEKKLDLWMMPDQGYLSGRVESVETANFELLDFNDHSWLIDYSEADIPPSVHLQAGEIIKIIGEKQSENEFKALTIRPWGGGTGRQHRHHGGK
ncbi:MAG TPA: hypothetical protein PLW31_13075 [Bacteroidales bacterium]|nr:hypothetical protein [Bacteroidales bacterium]HOX78957.1 hypothetical protein [Bacteroidales bacterium]HPM93535.1 hypothetical protein [Bacteroidales bacterium]